MGFLYLLGALFLFGLWIGGNPLGALAAFFAAVFVIGMGTAPLHGDYSSHAAYLLHLVFVLGTSLLIAAAPALVVAHNQRTALDAVLGQEPRARSVIADGPDYTLGWLLTHGWLLLNRMVRWWMIAGVLLGCCAWINVKDANSHWPLAILVFSTPFIVAMALQRRYGVRPQKPADVTVPRSAQATGFVMPPPRRPRP